MAGKLKILFIEDVIGDAELIWREIEKKGIDFDKLLVDTREDFLEGLKSFNPDIIISDYSLPQFDGMKALLLRNELTPFIPFILVTGSINEEVAVECMKAGADDYILKENLFRLGSAIVNSINRIKLLKDKKTAEEELQKSEIRLQKAQSIAHVGNWEIDLSSKTVWCSEEALKIYGLNKESHEIPLSLVQKSPLPEFRAMLNEALDHLLKYNEQYEVEFNIKRANDGTIRSIYSKAELALNPDGDKVKVIGVIQDITDRKLMDEALKQSELRFKQISEHSGEWIWEVDKYGLYTYSNRIVKEILGYEPEEIVNKKYFYDFFKPEFREELKQLALNVFARKESFGNFTNTNIHKDGREVILSTSGIPVFDGAGNLICYRGVDTDITERERAEEALRESQQIIEGIINAIPVRIFWKDKNLVYLGCNEIFARDSGFTDPKDIIGKDDYQMGWRDHAELYREDDRQIIETGCSKLLIEESQTTPEGNTITLLTSKIPLLSSKGNITGVLGIYIDITDRKLAEGTLRESEKKYRNIFENVQDLYYETSMDGTILDVSPSIETLSSGQYRRDDLIGKSMSEFYSDPGERQSLLASLQDGRSVNDFEIRLKNRDGSSIPCSISSKICFDAQGRPEKIVGSMRDITKRTNAEEALNQERRMLRTLIDNLPDPIYVLDKDCRKVIANKADVENIGFINEADVLGKTDIELFPGEIGIQSYANDRKVIITGKAVIDLEEEFISGKGVKRWLQTTKIPLQDKDGNITGLVGIGHDITERKRAEEELNQSYAFSESLLKTIPFGMDIIDEEGKVLFLSETFKRLLGDEALGKKCWELYRDDKKACEDCPLTHGITIGETDVYESHGVFDNKIFEISHTGMMYQGKRAMLEIFQDITDRKLAEEELRKAKDKAEESDRLKTAFLHNISHEIRTPMNAIVGFSTLLSEPDVDEESRQSYTEVIMQSSNHLLSIITDIVDISNIEANLVRIFKDELNLNSTLKRLYDQFIPIATEKKLTFTYETDLSQPDAFIMTDETKLIQIISNLINNAFKFTNNGYIKFGYKLKNDLLEFFVSDTGIGIPEDHHTRIFDRFYQVMNLKSRVYEGTGLGLAISRAYVELLGGNIWLSSEPGTGTSFFFTIPHEKQMVEPVVADKIRAPESFMFPIRKTILVAEDIESNFKLIKYFLSRANTDLIRAHNGMEAVEILLTEKNIDLVLMDIKMPVMDGYTAVKLIRETNSLVPVIAQTAYADDRERAIECGCSGFIAKPFDKKGLLKVLNEFI